MAEGPDPKLKACHCCGLVHTLPAIPVGGRARCSRCGATVWRPGRVSDGNSWAAAATLGSLLLYPMGIGLPVIRIMEFGHARESSILSGTYNLLGSGDYLVGLIVLVCSIVIPVLKLVGLLLISTRHELLSRRDRATTYRLIDAIGRWGMVDVLLVGLLVAFIKIGDLVEVSPGPGLIAFSASVCLSLLASAFFNPHALWEREP